jgi:hypothetical protein
MKIKEHLSFNPSFAVCASSLFARNPDAKPSPQQIAILSIPTSNAVIIYIHTANKRVYITKKYNKITADENNTVL